MSEPSRSRSRWTLPLGLLLVLGFAAVSGVRLGAAPVCKQAELRVLDVSRGMLDSGDWLVPRRHGELRLNKPPLGYWSATLVSQAAGGLSLASLRAPSWLAAVGLVALTLLWGRQVGDGRLALLAGLLLAVSPKFQGLAREGTAEMQLALFGNLALAAYALRPPDAPRASAARWLGFVLAFAGALLAKASAALLIVLLPVVLWHAARRGPRALLAGRAWLALLLGLALGLAWYVALIVVVPEAWGLLLHAALVPFGISAGALPAEHAAVHYGGLLEQPLWLLSLAAPMTLLLPVLLWRAWTSRGWRDAPRLRFCAVVVLSLVVAFSLLPQKRPHYLLPTLPCLALLTAESLLAAWDAHRRVALAALRVFAVLALPVGVLFAAFAWAWLDLGEALPTWFALLVGVSGLLLTALLVQAAWRGAARRVAATTALALAALLTLNNASVEVWIGGLRTGAAASWAAYDAQHWADLRVRFELVAAATRERSEWVARLAEDPVARGTMPGAALEEETP